MGIHEHQQLQGHIHMANELGALSVISFTAGLGIENA